jgi:hypothetical protein
MDHADLPAQKLLRKAFPMKMSGILASGALLVSACGGVPQNNLAKPNPTAPGSSSPVMAFSPIPDDIGLVLECKQCVFVEEKDLRYIAGEVHNSAKQAITGHVLAVDLIDAKGEVVRKIPGLMLMEAMVLQPGETKKFKERVMSTEANVTQASVYFKKAGRDVKLSNPINLKLQR